MNIDIHSFFCLKSKPKDPNDPLILKEKQNFLNFISNSTGHNITSIETIFLEQNYNFGNILPCTLI